MQGINCSNSNRLYPSVDLTISNNTVTDIQGIGIAITVSATPIQTVQGNVAITENVVTNSCGNSIQVSGTRAGEISKAAR